MGHVSFLLLSIYCLHFIAAIRMKTITVLYNNMSIDECVCTGTLTSLHSLQFYYCRKATSLRCIK